MKETIKQLEKEIEVLEIKINSFPYWSLNEPRFKVEKGKGFQTTSDLREKEELGEKLIPLKVKLQTLKDVCEEIEKIPSRISIGKIGNVYVNGKELNEKDKLATEKAISSDLISRKELLKKFQGEEE